MALHLSLFGLPRVQDGEQQAAFPLIKPTFLLVFLALRGEWVSREELTRLLRGAEDEGASLGSLRLLLTYARAVWSPAGSCWPRGWKPSRAGCAGRFLPT